MIETSQSHLRDVCVHIIGNKSNGNPLTLSNEPLSLDDPKLRLLLTNYFVSNFQSPEFFSFTFSNEDFTLNPLYRFVAEMFEDGESRFENSINIAKHLYEVTQHPNIKQGDLYVCYFNDLVIDNKLADAIGIFKSENKETYLKLTSYQKNFSLAAEEGISLRRLDKGCLIFNMNSEEGYRICIVDNANRSEEALFWKRDFLNVKPWSDAFYQTQNFLSFTKQYVVDQMQQEFSVSKADQIDLLNRSVNFFKEKEQFDQREFEVEVLGDANVIESFRKYGKAYENLQDVDLMDNFEISVHAVKRQARIFKSVIKLDKNFHIYIHGNRELIEKGFDEVTGRNYYKLYFDQEH
jgi:37-kD nucleoid-associated bacterial protein